MQKYLIIVEGKADIIFLRDYLIALYLDLKIIKNFTKKNKREIVLKSDKIEIKILIAGGYTAIKDDKFLKSMETYIDDEYKILVIQDADDPTKDDGGIENRMKYLDKIDVEFETFLFPNHQDNGDLETLLLGIIDKSKYVNFLNCYTKYISCIKDMTQKDFINELLDNKNRVFSYFTSYYGMENSKEENREYTKEYWDFNSDYLKRLKEFLEKNIKH